MKRKIFTYKNILCLLSIILFCSCSLSKQAVHSNINEYDLKMLKACELYADNYEPLHYLDGDSLELGRFNSIPDSINNYLIECSINNDFRALIYSYAIILQQSKDIEGIVTTPLVEHFIEFQPNGFVELFMKAMGVEKDEQIDGEINSGMIYSEPLFFADLCEWAEKNKNIIENFNYIKKYKHKSKKSKR